VTEEGEHRLADSSVLAKGRATSKARRVARGARLDKLPIWDAGYAGFCLNCSYISHGDFADKRLSLPQFLHEEHCSKCGFPITWHPQLRDRVKRTLAQLREQEAASEQDELERNSIPLRDPHGAKGAHGISCRCGACQENRQRFEEWRIESRAFWAEQERASEAKAAARRRERDVQEQLIEQWDRQLRGEARRETIEWQNEIEALLAEEPLPPQSTRTRHKPAFEDLGLFDEDAPSPQSRFGSLRQQRLRVAE